MFALPSSTRLSDEVQGRVNVLHNHTDWELQFQFANRLCEPDDVQQYQSNWEVRFWLGEERILGLNTSLAKDERIRCPRCVLTNNSISLLHRGMKVLWPRGRLPDLPEMLETTLGVKFGRANFLGHHSDSRQRSDSTIRIERSRTGSARDREGKRRKK
jgi:hypothetical protein